MCVYIIINLNTSAQHTHSQLENIHAANYIDFKLNKFLIYKSALFLIIIISIIIIYDINYPKILLIIIILEKIKASN